MHLDAIRAAIDEAPRSEPGELARRTRNAIARGVVAAAFSSATPAPPEHEAPTVDLREQLGDDLTDRLLAVYAGGDGWLTQAIDALGPLHEVALGSNERLANVGA
jgi:hypothetical protein